MDSFSSENTPTRYFTIFVPLKSQANFKTSPNWSKFLINDVIPEVVIILDFKTYFLGSSDHFYIRTGLKSLTRVNTLISMWRYDPLKQSFLLKSAQVTSSLKLIWGPGFGPTKNRPFSKIHIFVKKNFFLMRFFLLAPYDFGASFKIIKMWGKISGEFPFNKFSHAIKSTFNHLIVIEEMIDNNNYTPWCMWDA